MKTEQIDRHDEDETQKWTLQASQTFPYIVI